MVSVQQPADAILIIIMKFEIVFEKEFTHTLIIYIHV